MPVEFLSDEQAARYSRYHADPSPEQLARFFYLSTDDLAFVARRRRRPSQPGCAVQLCTLRFLGTFLPDSGQVPAVVVETLAAQLHVTPAELGASDKRISTWHEHQTGVVAYLGYAPFEAAQAFRLTR